MLQVAFEVLVHVVWNLCARALSALGSVVYLVFAVLIFGILEQLYGDLQVGMS